MSHKTSGGCSELLGRAELRINEVKKILHKTPVVKNDLQVFGAVTTRRLKYRLRILASIATSGNV